MKKYSIKFISLMLAICCLLFSFPTYAATIIPNQEISVSTASGSPGDMITVDISISGNPGIAYLKLKVDYDSDLSIVKVENKGIISGTFTTSKTTTVKPYVLQWMGADDSSANGVLATISFQIADSASAGDKPITVTVDECYNSEFDDVVLAVNSGKITIADSGTEIDDPPVISSIKLSPESAKCYVGKSLQFNAYVEGTQTDKSVTWTIESANSIKTVIDQNGKLTVGDDETARTIHVKATSNFDNSKYGIAIVTIEKPVIVSDVSLNYDTNVINITTDSTEGQVQDRIRSAVATSTAGTSIDTGNTWLMYLRDDGKLNGIGDGTNSVQAERKYYISYTMNVDVKYDWPAALKALTTDTQITSVAGFSVTANGFARTNAYLNYNSTYNCIDIIIPICITHTPVSKTNKATLTADGNVVTTCSVCGTHISTTPISHPAMFTLSATVFTYNGKAQMPTVTIKNANGKTIATKYYTVAYADSSIAAGTHKLTVTFKTNYTGIKTLSYKINPLAISKTTITGIANKVYTGKAIAQSVVVKCGTVTLKKGTDYTVAYKNNVNVGTASLIITGKGNFSGSVTKAFLINPKATTLKTLTALSKSIKVTWNKNAVQTTGYVIQYSLKKDFKTCKNIVIKNPKTVAYTMKNLKGSTRYYVRIRTYRTVNKKNYYSAWSAYKYVTTKK